MHNPDSELRLNDGPPPNFIIALPSLESDISFNQNDLQREWSQNTSPARNNEDTETLQ